jgi:alkanesulfonate monooxygenase SsuD/methylene tetrahydromethanopterin reductase-like flavin-dependent oxidoreductase (luciferase family)
VNLYREPSLLAKMASTLDSISHGRLELGLSAGWNKEECTSYGIAFPSKSSRKEMLGEATSVIKKMWTEESPSFSGKYYRLERAASWPKPVQKPHPPFWIGGRANETLRIAATEADDWIYGLCKNEEYIATIRKLREECKRVGRGWSTITKAWYGMVDIEGQEPRGKEHRRQRKNVEGQTNSAIVGTSEEVASQLRTLLDNGVTYFIPTFPNERTSEQLQIFASKVIPRLR